MNVLSTDSGFNMVAQVTGNDVTILDGLLVFLLFLGSCESIG